MDIKWAEAALKNRKTTVQEFIMDIKWAEAALKNRKTTVQEFIMDIKWAEEEQQNTMVHEVEGTEQSDEGEHNDEHFNEGEQQNDEHFNEGEQNYEHFNEGVQNDEHFNEGEQNDEHSDEGETNVEHSDEVEYNDEHHNEGEQNNENSDEDEHNDEHSDEDENNDELSNEGEQNDEHMDNTEQNDEHSDEDEQSDEHSDEDEHNDEHSDEDEQNDEHSNEYEQNDEHGNEYEQNDEHGNEDEQNDENSDEDEQNDEQGNEDEKNDEYSDEAEQNELSDESKENDEHHNEGEQKDENINEGEQNDEHTDETEQNYEHTINEAEQNNEHSDEGELSEPFTPRETKILYSAFRKKVKKRNISAAAVQVKKRRLNLEINQEDSTSQSESDDIQIGNVSEIDSDDSVHDRDYVPERERDSSSTTDDEISDRGSLGVTRKRKLKRKHTDCEKTTRYINKKQIMSSPTNCGDMGRDDVSDIVSDSACSTEDNGEPSLSFIPSGLMFRKTNKVNRTYDEANKKIYIRKVLKTRIAQNGQIKKRLTVWNHVHACKFCKQIRTNIAKHLRKHDQPEVKVILALSKKLGPRHKDVKARWDMLRNEGDHTNNTRVLKHGEGEIILGRRIQNKNFNLDHYGPCPGCFVWIKLDKTMRFHQNLCPAVVLGLSNCSEKSSKELKVLSLCESGKICSVASRGLRDEVFTIMKNDEITKTAQKDPVIVSLGNMWLLKNIGNRLKRKYYTSQRMRDAARLLLNLQAQTQILKPLYHFLTPLCFEDVVKAALTTASPDFDDEEDLKSPSTAIKLGYDVKRMTGAKWAMCLKSGEKEEVENCNDFLKLMQIEWSLRVTKIAMVTLQTRRFNQVKTLPNPDDLVSVQNHIKTELNDQKLEVDLATFRRAVELCQTRLLLYNKRRSGEVDGMTVQQYVRRQTGVTDIERSMRAQMSQLELYLLESQELIETRGKGGRGVPVIIPKDIQRALQYVSNAQIRRECGIHPDNPYLFPNARFGAVRTYDSLKKICQEIQLRQPEQITSVNLRKYTATVSQIFDLTNHQQQWLLNHMGHSLDVHKIHYRQTSSVIERVDIAKIMLLQEYNVAGKYAGKTLDSIDLNELVFRPSSETSADVNRDDPASADEPASLESCAPNDGEVQPGLQNDDAFDEYAFMDDDAEGKPKRKQNSSSRVPWTADELGEINKYFERHLTSGQTPGMHDCYKVIAMSKKNNGKIHSRPWETIKKKVWNLLQKKKKL